MRDGLSFLLIGLLLTSSFVSQVGFATTDSTEKKNSKNSKELLEFDSSVVAHSSSTTLTYALDYMHNIVLHTTSDSSVGPAVSKAAKLHKLFAHEDKEIKKEFQRAFLEFVKEVKRLIGKGTSPENQQNLNELGKAAIKVKSEMQKEERENEIRQKMDQAINLKNEKTKLQEIRNKISMLQINHDTDGEEFEGLLEKEQKSLTKVLISEAKSNGEKITKEKINEIKQKTDEVKEKNNKANSNIQSDSNNGHGSEKSKNNGSDKKSNGKSKGKSK